MSDVENDATINYSNLKREVGRWGEFFGWLTGVLVLSAMIVNFLHARFAIELVPEIQNTLVGIRYFAHGILDNLFFSWLSVVVSYAWYGLTWLAWQLGGQMPNFEMLSIPSWYKDLALISAVVSKAGLRANEITHSETSDFSDSSRRAFAATAGTPLLFVFLVVHVISDILVFASWFVSTLVAVIASPFGRTARLTVAQAVYTVMRCVTLGALPTLALNTVEWVLGDPSDEDRHWARWQYLSILLASVAAVLFFVWNGYMLEFVH